MPQTLAKSLGSFISPVTLTISKTFSAISIAAYIKRGYPIAFGLLIFFAIVELALAAWLTSRFNAHHNYLNLSERDRVRFILFCSTWTVTSSTFYLVLFLHPFGGSVLTSVASHLVFLFFTWIMWIAAAAAVTRVLGGELNCKTQTIFVYCDQLNALGGLAWFIWILVTFIIIVALIRAASATRRGEGYQGSLVLA